MYSLDINFLKYHPDYQKQGPPEKKINQPINLGDLIPVFLGVGVGLVFPGLVYAGLVFIDAQTKQVTEEITKLEEEGKSLDVKITNIKKLKDDTKIIQSQTNALITVFDQIRPWSAMLQDLRDRIPPRVQIETIRQIPPAPVVANNATPPVNKPAATAGTLEISGYARSYADVNDFVISLSKSSFINGNETKIKTAELTDATEITGFVVVNNAESGFTGGDAKIKPPQVVKYTVKAGLSTTPATELLQELEKKGANGLGIRLRNIQNTGEEKK